MSQPLPAFDLTGQNALITGSTHGLGRAAAELLAQAGAHVWINGRNAERCEAVTQDLCASGLSLSLIHI